MSAVREMTWRDIPRLARLEADIFAGDAWSEPTWWAELAARPRRDYVVLEGDGGSVGSAIEGYAGLDHGGDVADVMTVAVAPESSGRGYGDRLVGEMVRRARGRGASAVLLEVRADNPAARALYRRHGFEEISVRRRYYQPDGVDAVVLRLLLEERK
jgi:[ribosomal protein S18]-alanine N-acetyltransferase